LISSSLAILELDLATSVASETFAAFTSVDALVLDASVELVFELPVVEVSAYNSFK
jgi:hypothetical protein